jgi:hypothetical protein
MPACSPLKARLVTKDISEGVSEVCSVSRQKAAKWFRRAEPGGTEFFLSIVLLHSENANTRHRRRGTDGDRRIRSAAPCQRHGDRDPLAPGAGNRCAARLPRDAECLAAEDLERDVIDLGELLAAHGAAARREAAAGLNSGRGSLAGDAGQALSRPGHDRALQFADQVGDLPPEP